MLHTKFWQAWRQSERYRAESPVHLVFYFSFPLFLSAVDDHLPFILAGFNPCRWPYLTNVSIVSYEYPLMSSFNKDSPDFKRFLERGAAFFIEDLRSERKKKKGFEVDMKRASWNGKRCHLTLCDLDKDN